MIGVNIEGRGHQNNAKRFAWNSRKITNFADLNLFQKVWIESERRVERKLRRLTAKAKAKVMGSKDLDVLIVGNIAMYGLLEALVLEKINCRSDVVSFDFYHFAATPEFHFFSGQKNFNPRDLGDDPYFPNFWHIDYHLRHRPRWFAQGPLVNCLAYLNMRRRGTKELQDISWGALEYNRLKAVCEKNYFPHGIYWSQAEFNSKIKGLSISEDNMLELKQARVAEVILDRVRQIASKYAPDDAVKTISYPFAPGFLDQYCAQDQKLMELVSRLRKSGAISALGIEIYPLLRGKAPEQPADVNDEDWAAYSTYAQYWSNLADCYDTSIFQAAYPIIGHTAGVKSYFGYEIGTIRTIPFTDTPMGRQVYVGYKNASGTFITNSDYPLLEKKIEGLDSKSYFTPHAFDEEKVFEFAKDYRRTMVRPEVPSFLCPSRLWWFNREKADSKCNDLVMYATKILKDRGITNFVVEMVEWGPDIKESKELIAELEIGDKVKLIPTMGRLELWGKSCEAAAVIDQFGIPGFGGVAFESLALGARLITGTYEENDANFFGSAPPILRATNPEEIADAMQKCIIDVDDSLGMGAASQQWIIDWHSAKRSAKIAQTAFRERI